MSTFSSSNKSPSMKNYILPIFVLYTPCIFCDLVISLVFGQNILGMFVKTFLMESIGRERKTYTFSSSNEPQNRKTRFFRFPLNYDFLVILNSSLFSDNFFMNVSKYPFNGITWSWGQNGRIFKFKRVLKQEKLNFVNFYVLLSVNFWWFRIFIFFQNISCMSLRPY